MNLFESMFNWAIHKYNLKGKNTLIKIIKWFSPCELFVRSFYGIYIKENYADATWRACCYGYEKSVIPDFLCNIPKDGCFIDIGANIGVFSLLAAKNLDSRGVVISFEVNPITYYSLVRNIERNEQDCIMLPMNIGLSDETMVARVSFDQNHSGTSHIVDDSHRGSAVIASAWQEVKFIESIINNRETYIKIDVEGMELMVVKAAESFLRNSCVKMVAIEIDGVNMGRYDSAPKQLYDLFADMGFSSTINANKEVFEGHYDEVFVRKASD